MERVSAARGYCKEHAHSRGTVALTLRCVVFSFILSVFLHAASSLLKILSLRSLSLSLTHKQMHNLSSRDYSTHHSVFMRKVESIISQHFSSPVLSSILFVSLLTSPLFFSPYNTSTLYSLLHRNSMDNLCMCNRAHTSSVAGPL